MPINGAQQFSEYVISHFIKQIYPEDNDPLLGESNARKIFQELLLDQYAAVMAKRDDLGITKTITRQLPELQQSGQQIIPMAGMKKYEMQIMEGV